MLASSSSVSRPIFAGLFVLLLSPALEGQQCTSVNITPGSATFQAAGGTGTIAFTATPAGCSRTVTSGVPWITITFGQEGTGSGTAGYTVLPNPNSAQRAGIINIAGQTLTVTQGAASCSYALTPSSVTIPGSASSGSFDVASNCSWTASTSASWITITNGSGTGNGTVSFMAAPNTGGSQRSGTITVGNAIFTLAQTPPCTFAFSSSGARVAAAGGSFTVQATASANSCERNATSTVDWIRITSNASGTGTASIGYTVAANTSSASRLGTIRVGEQTFVVSQDGSTCLYTLTPAQSTIAVNGGSGTFSVTTGTACTWTAESTVDWVLLSAAVSGTGNGTVSFAVAANSQNIPRTGAITVGNTGFLVSQPAAGCDFRIDPESATIATEGGTGAIEISGPSACAWSAAKSADWITLTPPVSATGDSVLRYAVSPNTTIQTRRSTITIAGKIFQIVQAPANCNVGIGWTAVAISAAGGTGNLPITANCEWRATSSFAWIQITSAVTGTSNSTLAFSVQPNTGTVSRTGNIIVNGQTLVVTQASQSCTLTVSPSNAIVAARGGTFSANVNGGTSCTWSASSNAAWAETIWTSVNGSGAVTIAVGPNTSGSERTGIIAIGNQTLTVRQPALTLVITAEGVVNAASFRAGAIAPGEVITIFGGGFGPPALKTLELSSDRQAITTRIGETRVLFDGVPAPMVYTSDGQLSAIVPYTVASNTSTRLQVEYLGALSNTVSLPVTLAAPAIFSADSTGLGPGAILNQDFTLNTAQTPAARGSVIQIFATGEGQTRPAGVDGKLAAVPLPTPLLPVTVTIGGRPATVLYAGGAPGLVAGVIQINARVPDEVVPASSVPVTIRIGEFASRDGITVSVR